MKIVEFGNSVDTDEAAHNAPPHLILNLHCLIPSSLNFQYDIAGTKQFWKNCRHIFIIRYFLLVNPIVLRTVLAVQSTVELRVTLSNI